MNEEKPRTHTAWAIQQQRARRFAYMRALEIGQGRIDAEGVHIFLDRMPLGGFSGYIKLLPNGVKPAMAAIPQRPGSDEDNPEEEA
ncbi:MAG: hypothetical protein JO204_13075 [Alphaproteobacteria bacterium]|nr:hypothetical protein [Alphaproteobacteria bacterium]